MCGIHQSKHSHIWKQGGGENDGEVYPVGKGTFRITHKRGRRGI